MKWTGEAISDAGYLHQSMNKATWEEAMPLMAAVLGLLYQ
jgi:hypothetical protein